MKMKTALSVLAAAVAAVLSNAAFAADEPASGASAPKTRAERKAETMKARKEGTLTPAGETAPEATKDTTKSTKTRAERKAETQEARKEGKLAPAGTKPPEAEAAEAASAPKSTKTRAERKAETKKAREEGKLTPAGEGTPK